VLFYLFNATSCSSSSASNSYTRHTPNREVDAYNIGNQLLKRRGSKYKPDLTNPIQSHLHTALQISVNPPKQSGRRTATSGFSVAKPTFGSCHTRTLLVDSLQPESPANVLIQAERAACPGRRVCQIDLVGPRRRLAARETTEPVPHPLGTAKWHASRHFTSIFVSQQQVYAASCRFRLSSHSEQLYALKLYWRRLPRFQSRC
jgi:hypothetical protein